MYFCIRERREKEKNSDIYANQKPKQMPKMEAQQQGPNKAQAQKPFLPLPRVELRSSQPPLPRVTLWFASTCQTVSRTNPE